MYGYKPVGTKRNFNPHLPRGRWRYHTGQNPDAGAISIHTFLAEGDLDRLDAIDEYVISIHTFLAEGDVMAAANRQAPTNISIHTFLAEGDVLQFFWLHCYCQISIHTFLAEGDGAVCAGKWTQTDFNPHLPRGRWPWYYQPQTTFLIFQSTPSSRKVTGKRQGNWSINLISIHTFLAEGDSKCKKIAQKFKHFNPHLPRGRWHEYRMGKRPKGEISIHTFLAEGDCTGSVTSGCSPISIHTFLAEGDPSSPVSVPAPFSISIHTFLAEGDAVLPFRAARPSNFNPHLPRGRWPEIASSTVPISLHFNPHLPRGRWRISRKRSCRLQQISIHTFLAEGDTRFWSGIQETA